MALKDFIVDTYAALSHKAPLSGEGNDNSLAPSWVTGDAKRRLDAYKVLAAYLNNVARHFLPPGVPDEQRKSRREYGDPDLLVDRIMAGVLGDNFEIVVEGADADLPDAPELPPEPQPPTGDTVSDIDQRVYDARHTLWETQANAIVDRWEADWAAQPGLQERQEWLRGWADDELLVSKIVETERDIVGLGDGVYVLSWSNDKQRPVVDIYDPGFYFPVLTDTTRDYPLRVHVAWEFVDDLTHKRFVRRLTWDLAPIFGTVDEFTDEVIDPENARLVAGEWVRDYPWNVDDSGAVVPSNVTCYFTDVMVPFDELDARHVNDFDLSRKGVLFTLNEDGHPINRLDLGIDFLPVVHVPNTPAHREHFGKSVLTVIAQIIDDISATDTDVQAAAALAAGPVVHLAGAALPPGRPRQGFDDPTGRHYQPTSAPTSRSNQTAPELEVRPGSVFRTGENGRMDVLDMSKGLAELRNVRSDLLERFEVNGRVPAEVLGRPRSENAASSGFHELLRFGPFTQLIGVLRMTREPKGRLILKFAQRLGMLGEVLDPGPTLPARFAFGSYLPSDRKQLVEEVATLLGVKGGKAAISTQTAVALLVAGGFSIDDARGEVQRIHYENGATAKDIADATNSDQLAADFLGVDLPGQAVPAPTPPTPPAPTLPPTPPPPA